MDHASRRSKLAARLPEWGADAFLVTRLPNVRYLTGFTGSNAQVLLTADGGRFFTDGRYETPQPHHSWNANHLVTNLVLFHLQRHSDHHAYPSRRYQSLRHFEDLPQLPSGYAGMFPLAYVPPLWFKVMDPRLLALPQLLRVQR